MTERASKRSHAARLSRIVAASIAATAAPLAIHNSASAVGGTIKPSVARDGVYLKWTFDIESDDWSTGIVEFNNLASVSAWRNNDRSHAVTYERHYTDNALDLGTIPAGRTRITVEGIAASPNGALAAIDLDPGPNDLGAYAQADHDLICDITVDGQTPLTVPPSEDGLVACGTDAADTIDDHAGSPLDLVVAGDGNDTVTPYPCGGLVTAGGGSDTIDGTCDDKQLASDAIVYGGEGDDTITMVGARMLDGGPGADTISASGATVMFGDGGDDHLSLHDDGLPPDQTFTQHQLFGDAGSDVMTSDQPYATLFGGNGEDRMHASGVARLYGQAEADDISGGRLDQQIHGGDGNDSIRGGAASDSLYGEAGDDLLEGQGGPDVIYGGRGDDHLLGGSGADGLYGGPGRNRVVQ